jgi:hypothetical protein
VPVPGERRDRGEPAPRHAADPDREAAGGAGQIVDRYDKRFCSGQDGQSGDLAHYSPGGHCSVWAINGVRCGALICYDYRFPELYREYKRSGVEIMFHSFHAASASAARMAAIGPELAPLNRAATHTYPGITMPAVMTAQAAVNHMWISRPNSSAPQSFWPAFAVRVDGVTVGRPFPTAWRDRLARWTVPQCPATA